MTNPARTAIEESFLAWTRAIRGATRRHATFRHRHGCPVESCETLTPDFPVLRVQVSCTGSDALAGAALSWPRAVRGRTRHLAWALDDAWVIGAAFGYGLYVSPEPVPAARELFDDHIIRLPMSPGIVASRAEVRVALTRTVGALGWGLTDGRRAFPALAETVAGVSSLVLLDFLGVEIRWSALGWDRSIARSVTTEEVKAARQKLDAAIARLGRVVAPSARPTRGGSRRGY